MIKHCFSLLIIMKNDNNNIPHGMLNYKKINGHINIACRGGVACVYASKRKNKLLVVLYSTCRDIRRWVYYGMYAFVHVCTGTCRVFTIILYRIPVLQPNSRRRIEIMKFTRFQRTCEIRF